jgi:RNA polymerase sigma factor (sigma-70 family)
MAFTTDPQLVTRAQNGDPAAWEEILRHHGSMLRNTARRHRLIETDAADAVQRTWLICFEQINRLRDPERFVAWLNVICRRECLRMVREQRRTMLMDHTNEQTLLGSAVDSALGPDELVVEIDEARRLHAAIRDLPRKQHDVLVELMRDEGDGYVKVARRLGVPIGSLGPTRARAIARLSQDDRLMVVA